LEDVEEGFEEAAAHTSPSFLASVGGPFPKPETTLREEWIKSAEMAVKDFGPNGSHKLQTWEIWNEPNMPHELNLTQAKNPKEKKKRRKN